MNSIAGNSIRLLVWCIFLFIAAVLLHTRHNDFPWYYHPDEPGKVEQIIGMRPWNFHHPMLLLSTTKAVVKVGGITKEQSVAEVGRTASAVFTALAIVALSLLAYRWKGWIAGITAGLSLLLHHQLFELSHYLKEDSAMLLGVAVTFLAAHVYERMPSMGAALALGVACGLAISGKYVGVISLGIAVPVILRARGQGVLTAAAVGLASVLLIVNFPLLSDWQTFSSSFARETNLVIEGQGQITQRVPHTRYWSIFLANTTPVTWVLLLIGLWACTRRAREHSLVEWMMIIFPFAYAVALSFSPKDNDRYFLPATALFTTVAACAIGEVAHFARTTNSRRAVELGTGLALVFSQFPNWTDDRGGLLRYVDAFQRDDTAELVTWIRQNIPSTAVLAKDEKVRLPTPERQGKGPGASLLPHRVLSEDYVADLGSLDELRAKGVTHLIITPSTYKKFERPGLEPKENGREDFERRKLFYALLRRDYEPVRTWRRSTVLYLHPGLEVYRITPAR